MTESLLEQKERIDRFELSDLHSEREWQEYFEDCLVLLEHPELEIKNYVIDRLQKGLWAENCQKYRDESFSPPPEERRLLPILEAIAAQGESMQDCLLAFTRWASFSDEQQVVFSNWLKAAQEGGLLSEALSVTVGIQAQLFSMEDWNDARNFIEPYFAHENDLLRAAAASAFGAMYANAATNLPELSLMMQRVKEWEIERPGFAGPFLGQLLMDYSEPNIISAGGVDLDEWLLEIIGRRKKDEPALPMYCGIDFHAHEVLSGNPSAVRKLLDYGAESLAAMAATELDEPLDGMQEILEQLAFSTDYFVSRISNWHLSYHYRLAHPEGLKRGFIEKTEQDEVEIYLVFDPENLADRPFAATIFPRSEQLSDALAWSWVDKLVPRESRPPAEANKFPFQKPQIGDTRARYAFGHYYITFYGDSERKLWNRVWVKWPEPKSQW